MAEGRPGRPTGNAPPTPGTKSPELGDPKKWVSHETMGLCGMPASMIRPSHPGAGI